jgi:glycosyltransferase involved in cell wall biosynthesis
LNQTFKDFELIIIDDKSTDESLKIIKSFSDHRIRILRNKKNLDITASLNLGIKSARGDYLARMDADDISLPERFQIQVNYLDKHPDIGIVGSYVEAFGRVNGVWKYFTDKEDLRSNLMFNSGMGHPSVMMRKGLMYDEAFPLAQDYELWSRSSPEVSRVNIPKVLLRYRTHDSQKGAKKYDKRTKLIEKIRRRELDKFGLKFTKAEFRTHNQIAFGKYGNNLVEIEKWLLKIKNHNEEKKIFNQKSLNKVLDGYWFQACLANRTLKYFKGSLHQFSIRSIARAIVILTSRKNKILYILPDNNPNAPTHYVHLYEMIDELRKDVPLKLLVENQPVVLRPFLILQAILAGYKTVYVHYSYSGAIFSAMIARLFGGKVYYWHCEAFEKFYSDLAVNTLQKKIFDELPMTLSLKLVNTLVTGTEIVKKSYQKTFSLPEKKIQVIPNWINLERFNINLSKRSLRRELSLPEKKQIILFAHRLAPRKGADYLPLIIEKLSSKNKDLAFVIAGGGGGPLEKSLRRELPKGVIFKKSVPNVAIPRLMAACDLLIMPSRQEGFPRVLIEAMAAGLPFVATEVGGVKDITSPLQQKFLAAKNDLSTFIEKTELLLKNPAKLFLLQKNGKKWVRKYSLPEVEKKFVKLFTS